MEYGDPGYNDLQGLPHNQRRTGRSPNGQLREIFS